MKHVKFILLAIAILSLNHLSQGQSIRDILLHGNKIAYTKNGDSLFVAPLEGTGSPKLVDKGLGDNGNQRLLNWSADGHYLTYEKNDRIYVYDSFSLKAKAVIYPLADSLTMFHWMKVTQAALSPANNLYFSATLKNNVAQSCLFKLNILSGSIRQLTRDTFGIGNVSISPDGQRLVYAAYGYPNGQPKSILHFADADGKDLQPTITYENTFFNNFAWAPNGRLLIANADDGHSKLFELLPGDHPAQEHTLTLGSKQPLFFDDDQHLWYIQYDGEVKKTGLLDLLTNGSRMVLSDNESYLGRGHDSQIFYAKETRTAPKSIYRLTNAHSERPKLIRAFASQNPLSNYTCKNYSYTNGDGTRSSAYIYLPGNFQQKGVRHPVLLIPYGSYKDGYPLMEYFLYQHLFDYLAKGYLVIFPNTRGISSAVQKDGYGKIQLEDTELMLDQIKGQFHLDEQQVWLLGHSHGAAMVYYYLTHATRFAGGIAINGAADWIAQAGRKSMSGLPSGLGGTPAELPDKYLLYSPLAQVARLNKPLLIVAGEKDTQIPANINALAFYDQAHLDNKSVQLLMFADEGHLIEQPANRAILWKTIEKLLKNKTL